MGERVSITIDKGVADVRMTRGDKMNALDEQMFIELIEAGERLKTEKGVRAVVLSGEGRAFCAGLDTGNFAKMASGEERAVGLTRVERTPGGSNRPQHAVMVWREVPVPVIAALQGVAYGGGFQLSLGADIRYARPDLKMSIMEVKWGLVPDMAGFVLLPRLLRDDIARELIYTGRVFLGEEAQELGLVTRVMDDPLAGALELAHEIAGKSPDSVRAAKRLADLAISADQLTVLQEESREQTELIGSPNQVEAVRSNLEKRAANFSD